MANREFTNTKRKLKVLFTFPFLCVKAAVIFSKRSWGATVASISLHRAMLAFSRTTSLESPEQTKHVDGP